MKSRAELIAIRNAHAADCGCEDCLACKRLPYDSRPARDGALLDRDVVGGYVRLERSPALEQVTLQVGDFGRSSTVALGELDARAVVEVLVEYFKITASRAAP